jgi:hypothetical protein
VAASFALDGGLAGADSGDGSRSGWIPYDAPPERQSVLSRLLDGVLTQPLIKYLTDCDGVGDLFGCGGTPGRWPAAAIPVRLCSAQNARPGGLPAQEFRDLIAAAVTTWNSQETAAGIDYLGDCTDRDVWTFNNLQNEVGWDDQRRILSATQAGVTRTSIPLVDGVRVIRESDVVLDPDLAQMPRVCLESTVVHEFGHLLGLGHSDDRNDLMYPSFDPSVLSTCKVRPSGNERARLQALYGVDRSPTVTVSGGPVEPGGAVIAVATATDPEGGAVTYRWRQTAGPAVTLTADGATVRFTAPQQVGETVTLQVTAFDRFLHPASSAAAFTVSRSVAPPGNAPSLESFAFAGSDAALGWGAVAGAVTYELCSRPVDVVAEFECTPVAQPRVPVNWDTALGAGGRSNDYRLITTGSRETFLRACNSKGCSVAGTGGISGGIRWEAWGIDYDYFALAYDVGTIQFTIVGVVNVSGSPRTFALATGPESDPARVRLATCGLLAAGQSCFGFLGPGGAHGAMVDILAEAPDRPAVEHRVRVR